MTRPRFTYLVYGFGDQRFVREAVATFFNHEDAADFAMHPGRDGFEVRNLYVSAGRYDLRQHGYRPADPPNGYAEWLIQVDAKRGRIAA